MLRSASCGSRAVLFCQLLESDMAKLPAIVLTNGHVDHITGPRCMVRMLGGPFYGRYCVAHTDEVLVKDARVLIDDQTGRAVIVMMGG